MKKLCLYFLVLSMAGTSLNCACWRDDAQNNKEVVLKTFEALNNREYDGLDQFIAKGYKRHCQATPEAKVESLDDFIALLEEYDKTFPDGEAKLEWVIAEGDLVAFWGTYSGTQEGPMGPFPVTGKRMVSDMSGFHRLENGKIVETWVTWDNIAALVQLGLFPPSGTEAVESQQ